MKIQTTKLFRKECECGYIGQYTTTICLPAGDLKYYVCPMCKSQLKPVMSVWVCLSDLKKEIEQRIEIIKCQAFKNSADLELSYLLNELCNSSEQKGELDVQGEPIIADQPAKSSVSGEHNTGEGGLSKMSDNSSEGLTPSSPVQNPKDDIVWVVKGEERQGMSSFAMNISPVQNPQKKCTCHRPMPLLPEEIKNNTCGRCGGAL